MPSPEIINEVINGIAVLVAVVISPFAINTFLKMGRKDQKLDTCVEGLTNIGKKFDDYVDEAREVATHIKEGLATQKQILTGDEGVNGLRGEVREIHEAFKKKNEDDHVRWGKLGLWQLDTDHRLDGIERHLDLPPPALLADQRKTVGPRRNPAKRGRRKGVDE